MPTVFYYAPGVDNNEEFSDGRLASGSDSVGTEPLFHNISLKDRESEIIGARC